MSLKKDCMKSKACDAKLVLNFFKNKTRTDTSYYQSSLFYSD